jgi:sugar-specific transcriptional regulator TrmB
MLNGKFMENLDKVDKLLRHFPHGVRATELAKKLGISRSSIYDYLNSLAVRGEARNEHSLWYPKNHAQSEPEQDELTGEADFLREKSRIREDHVNGQFERAYTRTMLLINAGKVSKEWLEKNWHLFKSLDAELQAIKKNPIEEVNSNRRRRIRKLKIAIVSEALKYWG